MRNEILSSCRRTSAGCDVSDSQRSVFMTKTETLSTPRNTPRLLLQHQLLQHQLL